MLARDAQKTLERIKIGPPFHTWGVSFYLATYTSGQHGICIEILQAPDRDNGQPKRLQYDAPIRTDLSLMSERELLRVAWHAWCSYVEHEGAESFQFGKFGDGTISWRYFDPHGDSIEAQWFEKRRQATALELLELPSS